MQPPLPPSGEQNGLNCISVSVEIHCSDFNLLHWHKQRNREKVWLSSIKWSESKKYNYQKLNFSIWETSRGYWPNLSDEDGLISKPRALAFGSALFSPQSLQTRHQPVIHLLLQFPLSQKQNLRHLNSSTWPGPGLRPEVGRSTPWPQIFIRYLINLVWVF